MAKDVYTFLKEDGRFNTFLRLARITDDLVSILSGKQEFTIFVPTDAAFAKLPPGEVEKLSLDTDLVLDIIRFHMLYGKHPSSELMNLVDTEKQIKASDNNMLMLNKSGSMLQVGNKEKMANVIEPDHDMSNGTVHVIDDILMLNTLHK